MSEREIFISISGEPNSGKRTLAAALHGKKYKNNLLCVLDMQKETDCTLPLVALVAVDSTEEYTMPQTRPRPLVQDVKSRTAFCAVVITKIDLVPSDFSDDHIESLALQSHLACWNDVDCFQVSSTSGKGLEELVSWISNTVGSPVTLSSRKSMLSRLLDSFLDRLAYLFSLPTQHFPRGASSLTSAEADLLKVHHELSDIYMTSSLQQLLDSDIVSSWNKDLMNRLGFPGLTNRSSVHRVSSSLVIKACSPSECASIEYIQQRTLIPTPRIHGSLHSRTILDYVPGTMLMECWSQLSWFLQFRIACTLRLYIRQLRCLTSANVGSLENGLARGLMFQEQKFGPFNSAHHFRRFCECVAFESWRFAILRARRKGTPLPPFPHSPADWTPVLIHGDLNWSNILLDRNRTVWLVDWADSGFYPAWMETLALRLYNDLAHGNTLPASWRSYRQFIAGTATKEQEYFWDCVYHSIGRFSGR